VYISHLSTALLSRQQIKAVYAMFNVPPDSASELGNLFAFSKGFQHVRVGLVNRLFAWLGSFRPKAMTGERPFRNLFHQWCHYWLRAETLAHTLAQRCDTHVVKRGAPLRPAGTALPKQHQAPAVALY
jgi:hypothetical protein